MEANSDPSEEATKIDVLDFRNNNRQLIGSYIFRILGIGVFGLLFILITLAIHPNIPFTKENFIGISIPFTSPMISIILIIIDVLFILYLHELIHASVFYLTKRQKPKIGMRGFIIFAAAPNHLIEHNAMILNALAPFVVISVIGIILIMLLPINMLPWIFIPTVINATAAGGDFMGVVWMLKHSRYTVYKDDGDVISAYSLQ